MKKNELEEEIRKTIKVTVQLVTICKQFILDNLPVDASELIEQFPLSQKFTKPDVINIHPSADNKNDIKQAAGYFGCCLAFQEAVSDLVHNNVILAKGGDQHWANSNITWTTVLPQSGGSTGGINFQDIHFSYPTKLTNRNSGSDKSFLTDPDLFLSTFDVDYIDKEVAEAISDCISCFRRDLYRPAATMLGKAVEGAWTQLIMEICNFSSDKSSEKISAETTSGFIWPAIPKAIALYSKKEFESIRSKSQIKPKKLETVAYYWTDVVRDSRNAIHFQYEPSLTNTYEKVAVLLLSFAQNVKPLYSAVKAIKEAAESKS